MRIDRRKFMTGLAASSIGLGSAMPHAFGARRSYTGPNIVIVRFGGGVRRTETIDQQSTFAPYLSHELTKRGTLIPNMMISKLQGVDTSHAEGTLNILTGRYLSYRDAGSRFLEQHLEPTTPTLFEYLRKNFAVPAHQALLINGEDRAQEEFFTYGAHKHYGVAYRSEMLSLYRYKIYHLRRQIEAGAGSDEELLGAQKLYDELRKQDYRNIGPRQAKPIERFWADWQKTYRRSGLVNPRGDRLLTELAVRALKQLRPKLMMINYQDPDYVHWGVASHYTRAIAIIDQELKRLVDGVDHDDHYRGNTIFVIVPDCGRDTNPLIDIPFQHHFNSRSAHEIWALFMGPGIARGRVLRRKADQVDIAPTIGALMGVRTRESEGRVLEEVFV